MPIASFNLNYLGRYLELGLPILQQAITNEQIRKELLDSLNCKPHHRKG